MEKKQWTHDTGIKGEARADKSIATLWAGHTLNSAIISRWKKTFDFISFYTDKHPFVIVWVSISQAVNDKTLYEDMNTTERGCKSVVRHPQQVYI